MRSALYVPGDAPAKLAKALDRGADEIIIDLEDAVPLAGKEAARTTVATWLSTLPNVEGPRLWVRINPGEQGLADVRAVAGPNLAGFCVAKAETVAQLAALDIVLSEVEATPGALKVIPLLESAAAIMNAYDLARAPRVVRLQMGEADLRADLGIDPGPDERELLFARSQVVLASAAAKIERPIAPVSTNFRALDALRESTESLKRLGFHGRACIHPAQIAVVNEVFTPTALELAQARDVVERHEKALASGTGVSLDEHGHLIDEAVVRSARRVLATHATALEAR
jgi:citrate lyase subunit beta/citryl-CoA lyase